MVDNCSTNGSYTVENITDQDLKKEMIRQTMSELGKRSAEKRRKKEKEGHKN